MLFDYCEEEGCDQLDEELNDSSSHGSIDNATLVHTHLCGQLTLIATTNDHDEQQAISSLHPQTEDGVESTLHGDVLSKHYM